MFLEPVKKKEPAVENELLFQGIIASNEWKEIFQCLKKKGVTVDKFLKMKVATDFNNFPLTLGEKLTLRHIQRILLNKLLPLN